MFKYPRTFHLPESCGIGNDDRVQYDLSAFTGDLVVTEKLDGSNVTLSHDGFFTRSGQTASFAAPVVASCRYDIPVGWYISGEFLPGRFVVFGVWADSILQSWDDTVEWAALLSLPVVPVLYRGNDFTVARGIRSSGEGTVIRTAGTITDFPRHCVKYVREGFVPTDRRLVS